MEGLTVSVIAISVDVDGVNVGDVHADVLHDGADVAADADVVFEVDAEDVVDGHDVDEGHDDRDFMCLPGYKASDIHGFWQHEAFISMKTRWSYDLYLLSKRAQRTARMCEASQVWS